MVSCQRHSPKSGPGPFGVSEKAVGGHFDLLALLECPQDVAATVNVQKRFKYVDMHYTPLIYIITGWRTRVLLIQSEVKH